jgi:hypothetical protein
LFVSEGASATLSSILMDVRLCSLLILLRSRVVMAPCSEADNQRSTLSSTISARNLPCSGHAATVMGRRKRPGPALPELKKSVPFFVSILGWCE